MMFLLLVVLLLPLPVIASGTAEAINIQTATLHSLGFSQEQRAPAEVISRNHSQIAAEISGRIISLPHKVGTKLQSGDIIAEIDCEDYHNELQQMALQIQAAQARLKHTRYLSEQAQTLRRQNSIAEETKRQRETDYLVMQSELAQLKLTHQLLQSKVDNCSVVAPYPALLLKRQRSLGEWVNPGTGLIELMDMSDIEARAQIHASAVSSLKKAGRIWLSVQERQYPVQLRTILPVVGEQSQSHEIRLMFTDDLPSPGAAGQLVWLSGEKYLPAELLVNRDGVYGFFVVEDQQARFYPVQGVLPGQPIPVPAQLDPAIPVIQGGRYQVMDGQQVRLEPLNK